MAIIRSISLTKAQDDFLNENDFVSASAIFQEALNKIIEIKKNSDVPIKKLQNMNAFLQQCVQDYTEFIEGKELYKQFQEFCKLKQENRRVLEQKN